MLRLFSFGTDIVARVCLERALNTAVRFGFNWRTRPPIRRGRTAPNGGNTISIIS